MSLPFLTSSGFRCIIVCNINSCFNGIDDCPKTFITALSPETVGKAALFSTSRLSKHAPDVMRKAPAQKGIPAAEETFRAQGKDIAAHPDEARSFAKKAAG